MSERLGAAAVAEHLNAYLSAMAELAPDEDQGILFFSATGPRTASYNFV